jgi:hypothetical protein
VACSCEHGDEAAGFMKYEEVVDYLMKYYLPLKGLYLTE